MSTRLKSLIATILIEAVLGYLLILGLTMTVSRQTHSNMNVFNVAPAPPPPPRVEVKLPPYVPPVPGSQPVILHNWAAATPAQRNVDFMKATQWVKDNRSEEEKRLAAWRAAVPQGTGARVTRVQPPNLTTHTLYWPAGWSKGPLPIIAWGNGSASMCSNSSLPYAAFLSEIASHGYFVVAVGNDDIDYPPPDGLEILADGRPIRTQASALTKAVDWAIAENGRAGSPYAGKLDSGKIAYMGHGCGGQQAMANASDPRATTVVLLNSAAKLRTGASGGHKPSIGFFEGSRDDEGVLQLGDANFAQAQASGLPMVKAALDGMGHSGAYPGPDRRWSKAVLAWLDWQLKGQNSAAATFTGTQHPGWSRVEATGLPGAHHVEPAAPETPTPQ